MMEGFGTVVFAVGIFAGIAWLFGTILKKAGYSRALGVLFVIPLINFVMLLWMVGSVWPIEQKVKELEKALAAYRERDQTAV